MAFPLNFGSLFTADSALNADQQFMNIVNQNVANVNTPGYSRQEPVLQTLFPWPPPNYPNPAFTGQMGTGVEVASVTRFRLVNLDNLFQNSNQSIGNLTGASQLLQQIQAVFGEPGASGVSTLFQNFFQTLQTLSQNPDDLGVRNSVLQSAAQLVNGIHSLNGSLQGIVADANRQVSADVQKINSLTNQIAALNQEISQVQSLPGQNANDLLDKRGQLLDQLSNLVNIQVSYEPNGSTIVSVGGDSVVSGNQVTSLGTYTDANGNTQVYFPSLQTGPVPPATVPVQLQSGELYGVINTRDNVLGNISTPGTLYYQLNQFVYQFSQNFNSVHELGYTLNNTTGVPFFNTDPDSDATADVDAGIGTDSDADAANINWLAGIGVSITDPRNIAASVASVTSVQNINNLSQTIDATLSLASQSAAFQTTPSASGTITINGVSINWTNTQSIDQILQSINSSGAGVVASFDSSSQTIELQRDTTKNQNYAGGLPADSQITVSDAAGNLSQVFLINTTNNTLTGTPATNTTGTPGDNTNMNFLASLQNSPNAALGNVSLTQYYNQIVQNLGTQTSQAQTNLTAEQAVLQQVDQQRQSISGVNLNDEATALTQAQESFNAAARVETTIAAMLNTVINQLGITP